MLERLRRFELIVILGSGKFLFCLFFSFRLFLISLRKRFFGESGRREHFMDTPSANKLKQNAVAASP
jgi:hypothetical protein